MHAPNPYAPPTTPTFPWPAHDAFQAPLASRSARLWACILDWLVAVAAILPGFVMAAVSAPHGGEGFAVLGVLCLLALWVFQWYLVSTTGQTLGKRWAGIRIVKVDGRPVSFASAVLMRSWLFTIITNVPLIGGMIWLVDLLCIFGDERRCLHDFLAGTKVVQV
jgi:uncharacterized RDD family membrane protein YckC